MHCETTQFAVAAANQPRQSVTDFVLIGHSHCELKRFTPHSLPISSHMK